MFIPSRKAAKFLGVHPNTLRAWANDGKIQHIRNPAGQRLYDVESFTDIKQKEKVCYCRVSSTKQKDDLERQVKFMRERYPNHRIIEDIGSGINFKRKGLIALLEQIDRGEIEEVLVAHRDRLARFGFEFIRWFIEKHGGKLLVLDNVTLSPHEELVSDITSIIHVFSCRLHGLRKYSRKIKEDKDLSKSNPTENLE